MLLVLTGQKRRPQRSGNLAIALLDVAVGHRWQGAAILLPSALVAIL
jgi:hypothetical protein